MRKEITQLFQKVGDDYHRRGIAELELHQGHDVHAFYRLSHNPSKVIHVQGYAGMSTESKARVWARLMNYDKMMKVRKAGRVSAGNEHEATIQRFPNFEMGVNIPYDPKILEDRLAANVPELR